MKPEYEDTVLTNQEVEAGKLGWTDFDYDAVDTALGNEEPEAKQTEAMQAAEKLMEIIRFVIDRPPHRKDAIETYGRRIMAVAWVLNPNLFDGASLRALAKVTNTRQGSLPTITAEFSRAFGVHSHGQDHAWNRGDTDRQNLNKQRMTNGFKEAIKRAEREIDREDSGGETLKAHRGAPSRNDVDPSMN